MLRRELQQGNGEQDPCYTFLTLNYASRSTLHIFLIDYTLTLENNTLVPKMGYRVLRDREMEGEPNGRVCLGYSHGHQRIQRSAWRAFRKICALVRGCLDGRARLSELGYQPHHQVIN